jgi:hypothetical protein
MTWRDQNRTPEDVAKEFDLGVKAGRSWGYHEFILPEAKKLARDLIRFFVAGIFIGIALLAAVLKLMKHQGLIS